VIKIGKFALIKELAPLHGVYNHGDPYLNGAMELAFKKVSDNSVPFKFYDVSEGNSAKFYTDGIYGKSGFTVTSGVETEYWNDNVPIQIRYDKTALTIKVIYKGQEIGVKILPEPLDSDLYLAFRLKQMDVKDIKYIELAT